ncbi:pectate lyase [Aureliella helgolandensis]|uniref:Choline-sulfatase n=1 Tax=Aureliella helgolandensis TaxID=2527968 RepID=A0A518G319_9BACT|nr:pectate lyase [Aureliella helgolandensis]QDV22996.1 Choline-sulfatase [Aureliella helgolandensis]
MTPVKRWLLACLGVFLGTSIASAQIRDHLKQPDAWFHSDAGRQRLDNVLSHQSPAGAWPKNLDTSEQPYAGERQDLQGTFDNRATLNELQLLALAFQATHDSRYQTAFQAGLDAILNAQYSNGGWPQRPQPRGYSQHITFNDGTMVGLMTFLREVAEKELYDFVSPATRQRARDAFDQGVQCILDCQIKVDGQLTAWCAQHDRETLQAAKARAYEHPSLSGSESAGIARLLMTIEKPSEAVRTAIEAAVKWFEAAQLTGIRYEEIDGERKVIHDPNAPPLWARFYEIETNRPIFSGRDGIIKYDVAEIEPERRNGYAWYGTSGSRVAQDWQEWVNRESTSSRSAPNILFIAVDDLNDWVGCLGGHPQAETPHIDRLAKRGVLFTNAHCASPACNPSRAALFSGQMPWNTGVWSNDSRKLFAQHPQIQTLPQAFGQAGYHTLGTGKMMHSSAADNRILFQEHFNVEQRWSPFTRRAVDYSDQELPSKRTSSPRHVVKGPPRVILPLNGMPSDRRPDTPGGESFDWGPIDVPDSAMGDAQSASWAIEQLQASHQRPFFLGVGFYRPHIPLWAPKKYFSRFEGKTVQRPAYSNSDLDDLNGTSRRWALEAITAGLHSTVVEHDQWEEAVKAYLACTTFVDAQIGRLLDALDNSEYGENTTIVLWSDHGWHLGEKQHWGKWTGWERSTRVLLAIVPPKNRTEQYPNLGQRCHSPVGLIDLYPTLTELCQVPAPHAMDGQSLLPLLREPAQVTERVVVTSFDPGNVSLRSDRWRYIQYQDGTQELYDLNKDPNEWTDLSGDPQQQSVIEGFQSKIPPAALQL